MTRRRRGAARLLGALAGLLALCGAACARAEPAPHATATPPAAEGPDFDELSPRAACLEAARSAEREFGLPEGLLVGIALNESGLHAHALNIGGRAYYPEDRVAAARLLRNGYGSAMAGCVQVNARVHSRRGDDWPLDPVKATQWAAAYLRQHYDTYGDWGMAVVRWHGGSPRQMTQLVCRVRSKIEVVAPESRLFVERCRGTRTLLARQRREGQALLELAEAGE